MAFGTLSLICSMGCTRDARTLGGVMGYGLRRILFRWNRVRIIFWGVVCRGGLGGGQRVAGGRGSVKVEDGGGGSGVGVRTWGGWDWEKLLFVGIDERGLVIRVEVGGREVARVDECRCARMGGSRGLAGKKGGSDATGGAGITFMFRRDEVVGGLMKNGGVVELLKTMLSFYLLGGETEGWLAGSWEELRKYGGGVVNGEFVGDEGLWGEVLVVRGLGYMGFTVWNGILDWAMMIWGMEILSRGSGVEKCERSGGGDRFIEGEGGGISL
ncbi:hypothetical protein Tco_0842547 [Tanacetum coccineum]|uniref:Uncharacterized protein n=1 Tax=Tanacetum coccineum TaxID=301880 RepID=A0ABQ5AZK8_9ASTR